MPFSSGRSVRAPASNATRTVRARVPGISTRWMGSPFGREEESIEAIRRGYVPAGETIICRVSLRARERCPVPSRPAMAATERHVRRRAQRAPAPAPAPTPPARSGAIIDFRDVSMRYPSGDTGLDGVSFAIQPGEFVFLVGASGSGKSTTMRLLIKETEATSGTLRVAGRDLSAISRRRVPYYRRNLGVVFQDYKLLPNRTVYENVAYALQVTGGTRREIREKVPDILRLTGLSLKLHSYPDQLSGGEQQRVSVARAFVNHPPLLLADEPTGNLDTETSIGIMQLLYRINRTGTTVVVATHDSHMVDRMRRRVIELSNGTIVRDEASGLYAQDEQTTDEFGQLLTRAELDRLDP